MLRGEPKGWEVTGIRAHSEEREEQDGHKRRMTKPSKGEFLDGSGFEDKKLWTINYTQAYFVEAVPTNRDTLKPVYVLLCRTAVPPFDNTG